MKVVSSSRITLNKLFTASAVLLFFGGGSGGGIGFANAIGWGEMVRQQQEQGTPPSPTRNVGAIAESARSIAAAKEGKVNAERLNCDISDPSTHHHCGKVTQDPLAHLRSKGAIVVPEDEVEERLKEGVAADPSLADGSSISADKKEEAGVTPKPEDFQVDVVGPAVVARAQAMADAVQAKVDEIKALEGPGDGLLDVAQKGKAGSATTEAKKPDSPLVVFARCLDDPDDPSCKELKANGRKRNLQNQPTPTPAPVATLATESPTKHDCGGNMIDERFCASSMPSLSTAPSYNGSFSPTSSAAPTTPRTFDPTAAPTECSDRGDVGSLVWYRSSDECPSWDELDEDGRNPLVAVERKSDSVTATFAQYFDVRGIDWWCIFGINGNQLVAVVDNSAEDTVDTTLDPIENADEFGATMVYQSDCDDDGFAEVRIYTGHEESDDIFGRHTVDVPDQCKDEIEGYDKFKGSCYYKVRMACGCVTGDDDDDDDDDDWNKVKVPRRGRGGRRYNDEIDDSDRRRDAYYDDDDVGDDYDPAASPKSRRSTKYQEEEEDDDEDEFDNDYDDFDEEDEEYDLYEEETELLGNVLIPNPLLDSMDPDGAAERFPEIARDPRFWFDMALFVAFLNFLSYAGPRDPYPDLPIDLWAS
mmetsp:Transcript_10174/g.22409  ORF Transcript_10174/g.22409 Transcript_10174/m.22409 type:complete len:645 (+) Transcript_10174:28-1962(+)